MPYFGRPNLTSKTGVSYDDHPSLAAVSRPAFKGKDEYRAWCADPATDHHFITLAEPSNPGVPVSAENPPRLLHGVIADYDSARIAAYTKDMPALAARAAGSVPYPEIGPAWALRTWSGKARLVWEFGRPVPAGNPDLLKAFLRAFRDESKARGLLPGMDLKCWDTPSQYYEIGDTWTPVPCGSLPGPCAVPEDTLRRILFGAAKGVRLGDAMAVSIPMELVAAEVARRWPGRWPGVFEEGARGPLFWLDDGIDRTGCQVVEAGVVCYSDRAGAPFRSWRDLLGESFTRAYEERRIKEAGSTTWFLAPAGKYLVADPSEPGHWTPLAKEDFILRLKKAGFSPKPVRKGSPLSEIEDALVSIQETRSVDGTAPFLWTPDEVVVVGGEKLLNNSTLRTPLAAADEGPVEKWSFCGWWFDNAFEDPPEGCRAKFHLWAWLKRFWQEAVHHRPKAGQALVIAGPVGAGKSLFGARIIGGIMGGFEDAGDVLVDGKAFNKRLAHTAVWLVDDHKAGADYRDARRFGEALKKAVASPWVNYHPKYQDARKLPWKGRVILTTNLDSDSLDILPRLDGSILDKLMLLRMKEDFKPDFPPDHVLEPMIAEELPYFLAFLRDWEPPPELTEGAGQRFGVAPLHDRELVERTRDQSPEHRLTEILDEWKPLWAGIEGAAGQGFWEGTSTKLLADIGAVGVLNQVIRDYSPVSLGRSLRKIAQYREDVVARLLDGRSTYRITL